MKFKVGDKVKFIKKIIHHNVGTGGIFQRFKEEELEKVKYTYEELKKSPIGTKVTFESGNIIIKVKENYYCNNLYFRNDNDLKGLKDTISLNKIIKIEEPEYQTVYESKPEILDEVEKRYLRGVIRPFRDKVNTIRKTNNEMNSKDNQCIIITFKNDLNMDFPNFEPNTMYKGMEEYKEYTLEELGL